MACEVHQPQTQQLFCLARRTTTSLAWCDTIVRAVVLVVVCISRSVVCIRVQKQTASTLSCETRPVSRRAASVIGWLLPRRSLGVAQCWNCGMIELRAMWKAQVPSCCKVWLQWLKEKEEPVSYNTNSRRLFWKEKLGVAVSQPRELIPEVGEHLLSRRWGEVQKRTGTFYWLDNISELLWVNIAKLATKNKSIIKKILTRLSLILLIWH